MIKNNLNLLVDLFLPRLCINCGEKIISSDKSICPICVGTFVLASETRIKLEFERKFLKDNLVKDFASAFVFQEDSPIQKIIHELKYNKNFAIGSFLGNITAENLKSKLEKWEPNLIMAIPLHSLRKAERGFNQAEIIAKSISKNAKIKFSNRVLKRIRFTQTQTKLNLVERKENMEGAFTIKNAKNIKNKNIVLVDDVITTGATVSECAKILMQNGAKNIFALSVAIAE